MLKLDPIPVGSGCIAQVHRGTLLQSEGEGKSSSREVAVKVIHPHVKATIEADLNLLHSLATAIEVFPSFKYWSLGDALMEFSGLMAMQVDMRTEADNLRRLRKNFKADPRVVFPEPIIVHPDVLVEEFMHGEPISSFINRKQAEWNDVKRHLAATSLQIFLTMLIKDNWTHGDIHPGNVLVNIDEKGDPRLILLDAGICTTLMPSSRQAFLRNFLEAARGDGRRVAQAVLATAPEQAFEDPETFIREIAQVVDRLKKGAHIKKPVAAVPGGDENVNQQQIVVHDRNKAGAAAVSTIFELCQTHRVKLDGSLSTVMISTFILEGLSRSLDPTISIFKTALPLLLSIPFGGLGSVMPA